MSSPSVTDTVRPGVPLPPGLVTGSPGDASVTVGWYAPGYQSAPILDYTVTASPGRATCRTSVTSCVIAGLTNGQSYWFTVTASSAFGTSPPSVPSSSSTPSVMAGGSPGVVYLGSIGASPPSSQGTVVQRDTGYSVALPNGRALWIFGDSTSSTTDSSASNAFGGGSSLMVGRYLPGQLPEDLADPQAKDSSGGSSPAVATTFLPAPTDTFLPDGSGRPCTPANGAVYTARRPTGATLLTDQSELLVTYTDVCVTSATATTVEGWGFMIFGRSDGKTKVGPVDVFPPDRSGASLPASEAYQSPVVADGQVTLFTSECTALDGRVLLRHRHGYDGRRRRGRTQYTRLLFGSPCHHRPRGVLDPGRRHGGRVPGRLPPGRTDVAAGDVPAVHLEIPRGTLVAARVGHPPGVRHHAARRLFRVRGPSGAQHQYPDGAVVLQTRLTGRRQHRLREPGVRSDLPGLSSRRTPPWASGSSGGGQIGRVYEFSNSSWMTVATVAVVSTTNSSSRMRVR